MPRSATATWDLKIWVFKTGISSSRNPPVQVNPPLVFDTVYQLSQRAKQTKKKIHPRCFTPSKTIIIIYIYIHTYVNSNLRTQLLYVPGSAKRFFSAVCMSFKSLPMSCQVSLKKKLVVFAPKKTFEKKKHPKKETIEVHMDVSKNNGIPKSSILIILIGFSIINHPF